MWEEWHELRFRGRNQQVTEDRKGPQVRALER